MAAAGNTLAGRPLRPIRSGYSRSSDAVNAVTAASAWGAVAFGVNLASTVRLGLPRSSKVGSVNLLSGT